ncbi:hypothetical protein [Olsenella massiliensis]|uniref:hypothetical protein n=1 Tax=Olsenella massiliensis TaxID=1622075 RepID=UPI000A824C1B|nr:hypothetical protein [Olsenella massiliensis]
MLKYVARRPLQAIPVPLGLSITIFWSGVLMIILFAGILHLLPSGGRIDPMLALVGARGSFCLTRFSRATSRPSATRSSTSSCPCPDGSSAAPLRERRV